MARTGRRPAGARTVEVYQPPGDERRKGSSGTGHLLDDGLVLTAAHVVRHGDTALVRLASGLQLLRCEVVWRRHDDPPGAGVDAALLRIVDADFTPAFRSAVRWGRLVTTAACPVEVTGFPVTMGMWWDGRLRYRDVAQVRGEILPGSRVKAGRHEIRVWTPVPPMGRPSKEKRKRGAERASRWSGMSGAGVCVGGLLVGLVAGDPDPTGGALTAVPVDSLLADPDFARLVGAVQPTPVELDDLLERAPAPARSPIGLLRAEIATVRFHGRGDIVADLLDWCRASEAFAVRLVTASAGEGKTRLAHEMVELLHSAGWCAGFLDANCPAERLPVLTELTEPLLLVVDYAEARGEQLRSLIHLVERRSGQGRLAAGVRLLLLARSTGEWWGKLRSATRILRSLPPGNVLPLPPLQPSGPSRPAAFRDAVADLHAGLVTLPAYRAAAGSFDPSRVVPPRLGHPRFGCALTMQMAALAGLLQHLAPVDTILGEPDEEILLRHEARFWAETAPAHGLTHLHPTTLRQLVAVATLCPVVRLADATELLGHLGLLGGETENTRTAVATWLHELYAADGSYWDALVPDALGEYLVGRTAEQFPSLLDELSCRVDQGQAERMLIVLCGASGRFPALGDDVIRYVLARPRPLAFAAIDVAVRGGRSVLDEALARLVDRQTVDAALLDDLRKATPRKTIVLASWAARLTTRLVDLRCAESAAGESGLVALADARQHLAFRLAELGRHDEAIGHAAEAVRLYRDAHGRGHAGPDGLVESLLNHASRLAVLGRLDEAVQAADEAVLLCRAPDREGHDQARLATALHHQALWLHDAGRYADAEQAGAEAVRLRSQQADHGLRDLAGLANSSMNYACYLHDAGRSADGLKHARAAVDAYRSLAEESPDAHLVGLGRALINLARLLAGLDDVAQALTCAEEAVRVYRQFVSEDTVNSMAELTIALANYGRRLAACERISDAIVAFAEVESLCLKLAADGSPDTAERLATVRGDLWVLRRRQAGRTPAEDD